MLAHENRGTATEQKIGEAEQDFCAAIEGVKAAFEAKDPEVLQRDLDHLKSVIEESASYKAAVNEQDALGNTALHTCFMLFAEKHLERIKTAAQGRDKEVVTKECADVMILTSKIARVLVQEGCNIILTNHAGKTALQNILHIDGVSPDAICKGMIIMTKIDIQDMLSESEKRQYFTSKVANDNNSQAVGKKKGGCIII
jgi:hypothetical protein